jgi:hypothetical protein
MTTTATNALAVGPRRRAPVWISIVNTSTAAVVLWFYALPSGSTYLVELDALVLVVSAVAIWVAVLAFIALAILVHTARARR